MMKLLQALHGKIERCPPVWLMRQAGRYLPEYRALRSQADNFISFCLNPVMAVEVTLQPLRRFNFDAAIIFSDILMVPYGLGQKVWFVKNEGPKLGDLPQPVFNPDMFHKRVQTVYEAISITRQRLTPDKALIGFAGSPWTVLTYMIEGGSSKTFEHTKELCWGRPDVFHSLLTCVIEATIEYLLAQIRAGADVVQLFDSWSGHVPALLRKQLVYEPTARIVSAVKAVYPDTPIIGFPRGLSHVINEYVTSTGVDAVGLDTFLEPHKVDVLCPVQGGLDPVLLVVGGDELKRNVYTYLDAFRGKPYIFNLGHGILPHTPLDHVDFLMDIIEHYDS